MALQWRTIKRQYSNKEIGVLGKIKAFEIFWNPCQTHGECDNKYVLVPLLPGFKQERYYGKDEEFLKLLANQFLDGWLDAAGLVQKQ